jgi:hypothetical protein
MGDIPSATTKTVYLSKAGISDGTNSYVAGKNLRMGWRYEIIQEDRIGNHDPIHGVGAFRGEVEFEFLASTDTDLHDWATPSSGVVAEKTLTLTEVDTATPSTRTWTVKARCNDYEETWRELGFIRGRIRGVLTDEPTEAVA